MGCIQQKTLHNCGMFVVKPVEVLEDCIKPIKSRKKFLISEIEIEDFDDFKKLKLNWIYFGDQFLFLNWIHLK